MSIFDNISKGALRTTQSLFGDDIIYSQTSKNEEDETIVSTQILKAIFDKTEVQANGYITSALSCEVLKEELSFTPKKGDTIKKGTTTYKIDSCSENQNIYLFILKGG